MNSEELKTILDNHILWLNGDNRGERANLHYANLSNANLKYADLQYANLKYADLRDIDLSNANLKYTNLKYADLQYADLQYVDLRDTDLSNANLSNADLRDANLSNANLRDADLSGCKYNYTSVGLNLSCPEEGAFIAWKRCGESIIKLQVFEDSLRSSSTTRKCRVSKALVLEISNGLNKVSSNYDSDFIYEVGKTIEVHDFDKNRWNECSTGIHCFITRHEAEMWES
jgi:hypothetical protein